MKNDGVLVYMAQVIVVVGCIVVVRANPANFPVEAPAVLEGETAGSQKQNYRKKSSTADTMHSRPTLSSQ